MNWYTTPRKQNTYLRVRLRTDTLSLLAPRRVKNIFLRILPDPGTLYSAGWGFEQSLFAFDCVTSSHKVQTDFDSEVAFAQRNGNCKVRVKHEEPSCLELLRDKIGYSQQKEMISQQDLTEPVDGEEVWEEKKSKNDNAGRKDETQIITVVPFSEETLAHVEFQQNTGHVKEKNEKEKETEQIWEKIEWLCVPNELCKTCCKTGEDNSKKFGEDSKVHGASSTQIKTKSEDRRQPRPSVVKGRSQVSQAKETQKKEIQQKQENSRHDGQIKDVELLLVQATKKNTEANKSKEDDKKAKTRKEDDEKAKASKEDDVKANNFYLVKVGLRTIPTPKNSKLQRKSDSKQNPGCIQCLLKASPTPPTLILYLWGQKKTFSEGNRRKKDDFGRHLMSCVLDTHTWVFTNEDLKEYLKYVRDMYSFKRNKNLFFFYSTESENALSALKYISEKMNTNLVVLFLNGDQSFLNNALEKKIPVIVIKGFGSFADDPPKETPSIRKVSVDMAKDGAKDSQQAYNCEGTGSTEETTQSRSLGGAKKKFTVFDLVSNFGRKKALRLSILDALIKDDDDNQKLYNDDDINQNGKSDTEKQQEEEQNKMTRLELAFAWGCFEKAQEMRWSEFKGEKLLELMEKALEKGQVDFVELFMDLGVDLETFFNDERLERLCARDKEQTFHDDLEEDSQDEQQDSMFMKLLKTIEEEKQNATKAPTLLRMVLKDLLVDICMEATFSFREFTWKDPKDSNCDAVDLKLRLFLWALLSGKFDLAKFLWREMQDHVTTALIACLLLRAMRSRTMDDVRFEDEQQEIITNTELFEGLAIKTINNCYKDDQLKTFKLLSRIQQTEYWSNVTCLEIAERARCKKFIAQEPCQNFADRIWRGLDPFSKRKQRIGRRVVFTRLLYAISAIYVVVPKFVMEFSQNKRGPSQLRYAFQRFCFNWPRFWEDPSFKFYAAWFFFIGFLLLYAYVLMVRISPEKTQMPEVALFMWFITMHLEELRVCGEWVRSKRKRVKVFLLSQLGFLNMTNYYLAWIGIFQWFSDPSPFFLHVILCLNFISFICRFFYFLSINSQLGPKVFMIYQMIKEIILFSILLLIIFLTYGVVKYSIENNGQGNINSTVVLQLPVEAFWLMLADRPANRFNIKQFQQLYNHVQQEVRTTDDADESDDDPRIIFRGLLRVVYLLFTSLLLINILIAAFSYLFEVIHSQKEDVRKYQKFLMIVKFYLGSPLPPPLTLIYYPILYICRCFLNVDIMSNEDHKERENTENHRGWQENRFRTFLEKPETATLLNWAKVTTEAYTEEKSPTVEDLVGETMEKNFAKQEKKTSTEEGLHTVGSSSGSQSDELTEDTHELHESIRFSTFSLNKAIAALVGMRTVCKPCIIYKRCVVCGKLPRNPAYLLGRHRTIGIQTESTFRRKSMPNLRKLSTIES